MENMREYWAREAEMMRDKSAVLGTNALGIVDILKTEENLSQEFDKDKIVMWLTSNQKGYPMGLKVITLGRNEKKTNCIFWWGNRYVAQDFPTQMLSPNPSVMYASLESYKNDISHLIHRLKGEKNQQKAFTQLIGKIETYFKNIKKIDFISSISKLERHLLIVNENRVSAIKTMIKSITAVYNPSIAISSPMGGSYVSFYDRVIILPLSFDWFNKNGSKLKERYENIWLANGIPEFFYPESSGSGEVLPQQRKTEMAFFKTELISLRESLNQLGVENTLEGKWLKTITNKQIEDTFLFIGINEDPWRIYKKESANNGYISKYISYIPVENSFGPFRISAPLSVIIHELTQMSDNPYLPFVLGMAPPDGHPVDGHMPSDYTKITWDRLISKNISLQDLFKDNYLIDHLYQSNRCYAAISLGIIIDNT